MREAAQAVRGAEAGLARKAGGRERAGYVSIGMPIMLPHSPQEPS